jgi:hypothetical protein
MFYAYFDAHFKYKTQPLNPSPGAISPAFTSCVINAIIKPKIALRSKKHTSSSTIILSKIQSVGF